MTIELVGGPCDGQRVEGMRPDLLFYEKSRVAAGPGGYFDYRRDEMPTPDGAVRFVYCGVSSHGNGEAPK